MLNFCSTMRVLLLNARARGKLNARNFFMLAREKEEALQILCRTLVAGRIFFDEPLTIYTRSFSESAVCAKYSGEN